MDGRKTHKNVMFLTALFIITLCIGPITAHAQEEGAQVTDSEDPALQQSLEEISR